VWHIVVESVVVVVVVVGVFCDGLVLILIFGTYVKKLFKKHT